MNERKIRTQLDDSFFLVVGDSIGGTKLGEGIDRKIMSAMMLDHTRDFVHRDARPCSLDSRHLTFSDGGNIVPVFSKG